MASFRDTGNGAFARSTGANTSAAGSREKEKSETRPQLLTTACRPLRRSTPELPFNIETGRHYLAADSSRMKATEEYRVPYSRSFAGRTSSGLSKLSIASNVDTRSVQEYIRRHGSRGSLHSSTSTGLVVSDNASSASSSQSRPVSADAENNSLPSSHPAVHSAPAAQQPSNNSRFVLPVSRPMAPPSSAPIARRASIPALATGTTGTYLDKMACKVTDFLYMSDVEAAYNANLLCRLNVGYVVDISNIEPLKIPPNKRSTCPCLCPLTASHSLVRMTLTIEETSSLDLIPYFDDVNRFIDSARSVNKSVLIHSYHGRNRCAVLVVQYLMKARKMNLECAIDSLKTLRPDVNIGENFFKSLRKWDALMEQARANATSVEDLAPTTDSCKKASDGQPYVGSFNNRRIGQGTPLTKRSAWV